METINSNEEVNIDRRTLEKDADEFSANRLMEYIFLNTKLVELYKHIAGSNEDWLKIIGAGMAVEFITIGIDRGESKGMYLPNAYRLINVLRAGYASIHIINIFPIKSAEYDKILIKSIENTIYTSNNFTSYKINVNKVLQLVNIGLNDDYMSLRKNWNKIRPMLDKHRNKFWQLAEEFKI